MNNNINALLNSLGKIREIRKADKKIDVESSTSDNTMAVGTQMYDSRAKINTKLLSKLFVEDFDLVCIQDKFYSLIVNTQKENYYSKKADEEDLKNNFDYVIDVENNEDLTHENLSHTLNILVKEHRPVYSINLCLPLKVEELTITSKNDEISLGTLYTVFSPFQYDINVNSDEYQYEEPSKKYSKGSFVDLIKNGRIEIYRIGSNDYPVEEFNLEIADCWEHWGYPNAKSTYATKLKYNKDFIFDSDTIIDFNQKFPFACFDIEGCAYEADDYLCTDISSIMSQSSFFKQYMGESLWSDVKDTVIKLLESKKVLGKL